MDSQRMRAREAGTATPHPRTATTATTAGARVHAHPRSRPHLAPPPTALPCQPVPRLCAARRPSPNGKKGRMHLRPPTDRNGPPLDARCHAH